MFCHKTWSQINKLIEKNLNKNPKEFQRNSIEMNRNFKGIF